VPDAARVRIEVRDTGIGIPADQLPHIYDPFYQAGGTDRPREGYGLGLSVVQRMVSLLGAQLDVHSVVGRGSTFTLLLPAGLR
jgi:signal transduction histidine kinase